MSCQFSAIKTQNYEQRQTSCAIQIFIVRYTFQLSGKLHFNCHGYDLFLNHTFAKFPCEKAMDISHRNVIYYILNPLVKASGKYFETFSSFSVCTVICFHALLLCLALSIKELETDWPARSQDNGLGWDITAYPWRGVSVG